MLLGVRYIGRGNPKPLNWAATGIDEKTVSLKACLRHVCQICGLLLEQLIW